MLVRVREFWRIKIRLHHLAGTDEPWENSGMFDGRTFRKPQATARRVAKGISSMWDRKVQHILKVDGEERILDEEIIGD